ncbi:hypothetical protein Purlil1_10917 [Purpureocillium lilacinum]|uniref:Uncharacterized protein n=1 Tax=Purpureocillium lilacinum TaxID=33203 RepID=A0ABR0BLR3_PURLI|nr:hypothetical protein Purlil1_10917 [Purpureocillium lilacinum]
MMSVQVYSQSSMLSTRRATAPRLTFLAPLPAPQRVNVGGAATSKVVVRHPGPSCPAGLMQKGELVKAPPSPVACSGGGGGILQTHKGSTRQESRSRGTRGSLVRLAQPAGGRRGSCNAGSAESQQRLRERCQLQDREAVLPRLDLCAKADASLRVLGYGFNRGNMVRHLHGGSGTMHPEAKLSPLLPCRGPVENGHEPAGSSLPATRPKRPGVTWVLMGSGKWHERADEALDVRASILAVLGSNGPGPRSQYQGQPGEGSAPRSPPGRPTGGYNAEMQREAANISAAIGVQSLGGTIDARCGSRRRTGWKRTTREPSNLSFHPPTGPDASQLHADDDDAEDDAATRRSELARRRTWQRRLDRGPASGLRLSAMRGTRHFEPDP